MKANPYLIGAGTFVAFCCYLVIAEAFLKVAEIKLCASDGRLRQAIGSGLASVH